MSVCQKQTCTVCFPQIDLYCLFVRNRLVLSALLHLFDSQNVSQDYTRGEGGSDEGEEDEYDEKEREEICGSILKDKDLFCRGSIVMTLFDDGIWYVGKIVRSVLMMLH